MRFLRPQEIPTYVEQGIFDLGISGRDWITETGADVVSLGEIGGGRAGEAVVKVVLAVPKESPWESAPTCPTACASPPRCRRRPAASWRSTA